MRTASQQALAPPAAVPRATAPQAMRGRDAERSTIRDLLRRSRRGTGGVVLISGEPGIGKSLLLRESVDEAAQDGFSLAVGTANRIGQSIPFFALRQALGEPFGEHIAGLVEHDLPTAPGWWIHQARSHLEKRAASAPVLVCLDDLQWACPATLAAVWTLPNELKNHPVAWVFARSWAPTGNSEYLFDLLEDGGATRITLDPLSREAVAGLLTDAFSAPPDEGLRLLAAGAAGNPWLLSELIDGLRDDDAVRVTDGQATLTSDRLPERLRRAAQQRLDGISPRARHLLSAAAVLGASFPLEDAAEMLGEPPAALLPAFEETMTAGITAAGEDGFSFRHGLLRRAVSDLIPPPGRMALHRQYGHLLLARGRSPILAAGQLIEAADPAFPASLADLDTAAGRTLRSAPQTAADLASHALKLTAPGDPDELPRAVAAAEALAAAGRADQAGLVARTALSKPVPPAAEARLRSALSSVLCARGETRDAAAEARLALAVPGLRDGVCSGPLDGMRGGVRGGLSDGVRETAMAAYVQALAGLRDELAGTVTESLTESLTESPAGAAGAAAGMADAVPEQPGDHLPVLGLAVAALAARSVLAWDKGETGEALELLRAAARRETAPSPDARRVQPLLALAAALVDLRQLDEAGHVLDAADTSALRAIPAQSAASMLRARVHLAGGRHDDAAAAGKRALAVAETLGAHAYASAARSLLAVIALRGGDVTSAAQYLDAGTVPGPNVADAYAPAEVTLAGARIAEAREGRAAAVTHIRRACADLRTRPGLLLGDPGAAPWMTRTALAADDAALAAAIAWAAQTLAATSPGYPAVTAAAAHSLGLVHRDPERLAEAAAHHPDPWSRASALEDLGVLHARQGDHDGAIRCLTQAITGYGVAAATADAARVRRRLRSLGVRRRYWAQPAARPATGWESLTDAERAAAELVAQGLNNRQVADRMYLSVHTVAFYMRQAFRKLGISSRVELTRIVIERGGSAP